MLSGGFSRQGFVDTIGTWVGYGVFEDLKVFGNSEFAPIQDSNYLFTYTGVLVLFSDK